jgi:hypothetical protein
MSGGGKRSKKKTLRKLHNSKYKNKYFM